MTRMVILLIWPSLIGACVSGTSVWWWSYIPTWALCSYTTHSWTTNGWAHVLLTSDPGLLSFWRTCVCVFSRSNTPALWDWRSASRSRCSWKQPQPSDLWTLRVCFFTSVFCSLRWSTSAATRRMAGWGCLVRCSSLRRRRRWGVWATDTASLSGRPESRAQTLRAAHLRFTDFCTLCIL